MMDSKNINSKDVLAIVGYLLADTSLTGGSWFAYNTSDTLLEELSDGVGMETISQGTSETYNCSMDLANGNTSALTTVLGSITGVAALGGITTGDPGIVVELITHDQKAYEKVEKRAKYLYDKYNNSHIKEKDEGATLIAVDEETAKLINSLASIKTKKELIMAIESLQEVLNDKKYESKLVRNRDYKN